MHLAKDLKNQMETWEILLEKEKIGEEEKAIIRA
jgi:hypothetical protein